MTFEQYTYLEKAATQAGLRDHPALIRLLHLVQAGELAKKQFRVYLSKMNDWELNCAETVRECIEKNSELNTDRSEL